MLLASEILKVRNRKLVKEFEQFLLVLAFENGGRKLYVVDDESLGLKVSAIRHENQIVLVLDALAVARVNCDSSLVVWRNEQKADWRLLELCDSVRKFLNDPYLVESLVDLELEDLLV